MDTQRQEFEALRRQIQDQLDGAASFGRRLKALRLAREMTLEELAARTGISKPYLSQIENGRVDPPRDDKVRRLEEVFGERPQALVELAHLACLPADVRERFARLSEAVTRAEEAVTLAARAAANSTGATAPGPPAAGMARELATEAVDDTMTAPRPVVRQVPIINRVAAGAPVEFTDLGYPVGQADEFLCAPPGLSDPNAFAVRIAGDSMLPRYREGDIVLFSPQATVHSGDDCYVRFAPEFRAAEGATFKRVYFDSEVAVRLQPLNDRYAPLLVPLAAVTGLYRAVFRYEAL